MNTKNYGYVLLIVLLCVILPVAKPSFVQASTTVMDEIEKSVPSEELVLPEKPAEVSEPVQQTNTDSVEESKQIDEAVPDTAHTESAEEDTLSEEVEKESVSLPVQKVKEDVPETLVTEKESQFSFSKIRDKLGGIIQRSVVDRLISLKNSFVRYITSQPFFAKVCKSEKNTSHNHVVSEFSFAPYYFIYPSHETYEKAFFSDRISDISELMPCRMTAQNTAVKIDAPKNTVTPQGTTDIWVLVNAPSPEIMVKGNHLFAKLVVDIRNNTLYKYDKNGFPLKAYLVATGARGTRTMPGLRVVTYKERFPYAGAPDSKRALDPYSYGPYILFLNAVEPRTGRQYCVEQLLHGNGNEYSIGRKVSHGCVRTNNIVMKKELSKEVKRGDYILLINPDID